MIANETPRGPRRIKKALPVPRGVIDQKLAEIQRLERELREAELRFAHEKHWSLGSLAGVSQRSRDAQVLQQELVRSRQDGMAMQSMNRKAQDELERERAQLRRQARRRRPQPQVAPQMSAARRRKLEAQLRYGD